MAVVQKLEQLSDFSEDITKEQICTLVEPLINFGSSDELMGLAKTSSRSLYGELDQSDRMEQINILVSILHFIVEQLNVRIIINCLLQLARLRIALDLETVNHTDVVANAAQQVDGASNAGVSPTSTPQRKWSTSDGARQAFLVGQSEERVHALSVIMLFLCSGLQHAQGVAS